MIPILFSPTETAFDSHGIGHLSDAISCTCEEERNGEFELELKYPVDGAFYSEIQDRSIILAKPNPHDDPEPFRVYRITTPMRGIVTIYAAHISYDLSGIPVRPFEANTASSALSRIKANSVIANPFNFSTDITTTATMTVKNPLSVRQLMGGTEGSLIDTYGGEYKYHGYNVELLQARGQDNGVELRYGKNITDLTQERNIASVYTGALPYWNSRGEYDAQVIGDVISANGSFNFTKIMPLDLSDEFEDQPTVAQLNSSAESYIRRNKIGVPKVSLSVSFVQLEQTLEYREIAQFEAVKLCDTVTVFFERLGVNAKAKVVKTRFDVLAERYLSVEIGEAKTNIADTIANTNTRVNKTPTESVMVSAIMSLTAAILGAKGGSIRLLDTDGDGMPDTLFMANGVDPATAQKVWRYNYEGWGASQTGINGPYTMGATFDSGIIGDFITAGTINANNVNVTNINGENIKDKTIGNAPIADGAATERVIGSLAVTNGKIGSGAVSYGKTSFTGTLDQVGVNRSNIEAIYGYFSGSATFSAAIINNLTVDGYRVVTGTAVSMPDGTTRNLCIWRAE